MMLAVEIVFGCAFGVCVCEKACIVQHMHAGFGMMGRHGDLFQDLLEYRVGAALVHVQHTLFVAHTLKLVHVTKVSIQDTYKMCEVVQNMV